MQDDEKITPVVEGWPLCFSYEYLCFYKEVHGFSAMESHIVERICDMLWHRCCKQFDFYRSDNLGEGKAVVACANCFSTWVLKVERDIRLMILVVKISEENICRQEDGEEHG